MAFVDIRLNEDIEQDSEVGYGFNTTVVPVLGGYEDRNQNWSQTRVTANVAYGVKTKDQLVQVIDMFHICRGRRDSFRFKNWDDFKIEDPSDGNNAQLIGVGDGADDTWQITRLYEQGASNYSKDIRKPVNGTVSVYVGGSLQTEGGGNDYTINYSTGLITFEPGSIPAASAEIRVNCEYDLGMRFVDDVLRVNAKMYLNTGYELANIPSIPLIEVRRD